MKSKTRFLNPTRNRLTPRTIDDAIRIVSRSLARSALGSRVKRYAMMVLEYTLLYTWADRARSHKEKVRRDNLLANRLREIVTRKARPKK